jgi:hypothetical protein
MRESLKTEGGQMVIEEMQAQCDPRKFNPENPTALAYQAGMRDAYQHLMAIHDGDFIDE